MKNEKFKLYDTAFKIGFGFNILVFVVLNIFSFVIADYEYANRKFNFSPDFGLSWGFPFDMTNPYTFTFNILIIAICGFIFGLIFRYVWSKFTSKKLK